MEHTFIFRQFRFYKIAQGTYQKVRQNLESLLPQKSFLKSTVFLWALAAALGMLAYQKTKSGHYNDWVKTHPPSFPAWSSVLRTWGYAHAPVTGEDALSKIAPRLSPRSPRVWQSIDQTAILVFGSTEVWLFMNEQGDLGRLNSIDWEALGWGWDALHALSTEPLPKTPKKQAKKAAPRDPKELNY